MTTILERPILSLDHPEQLDAGSIARVTHLAGELGIRFSLPDSTGFRRVFYPSREEVYQDYNNDAVDTVSTVAELWLPAITINAANRYVNRRMDSDRSVVRAVSKLVRKATDIEPGEKHWLAPHILRDPHAPKVVLGLDAQNASIISSHVDDLKSLGFRTDPEQFQEYMTDLRKSQ